MEQTLELSKSQRIGKLLEEFDKLPLKDQFEESEIWLKTAIKIAEEDDRD